VKNILSIKKAVVLSLLIPLILLVLAGCQTKRTQKTITIAEQYGLAYAPVQIMRDLGLLESKTADIEIEWVKLANTAAIRESMLAGKVDIAFMAIPPFLIGRDRGMEWKIISGLSLSPLGLMTYKEEIETIADISIKERIALPQPGSVQHILLAMAAEREFADAGFFDEQLVTMAHPDGMNALLSRQDITLHFTSPPYLFKEKETEGIYQILSGREAFGSEFSFIVAVGTEDFYNNYPEIYKIFLETLQESIDYIGETPDQAAGLLAEDYNLSEAETGEYISWPGMEYTRRIKGLGNFITFMQKAGYIDFKEDFTEIDISQLLWEVDLYED